MINDLLELFFPSLCLGCKASLKKTEKQICFRCHYQLSQTNHFQWERNELMQKFYGRLPLEFASSLYYFKKNSPIQEIIHELKYRNQEVVGELFAERFAADIFKMHNNYQFDCIAPVPLHYRKLKKRGYNQLDAFGKHLSKKLDLEYIPDLLIKTQNTKTQTRKSFENRNQFNASLFALNPKWDLKTKHILLIDDVVTTGTTLEECGRAIVTNTSCKLSIITMAYTA
jgi:ComF family protein